MSKNQQYAMKYAEYAMEQMRRYGIPASVTLAQGILESSNGKAVWRKTRTIILAQGYACMDCRRRKVWYIY